MGCGSSHEVADTRPQRPVHLVNISRPVDPPGAVPAPARDAHGAPLKYEQYDLTAKDLHTALTYAAEYLHSKGENALIITVGGAVNTPCFDPALQLMMSTSLERSFRATSWNWFEPPADTPCRKALLQ